MNKRFLATCTALLLFAAPYAQAADNRPLEEERVEPAPAPDGIPPLPGEEPAGEEPSLLAPAGGFNYREWVTAPVTGWLSLGLTRTTGNSNTASYLGKVHVEQEKDNYTGQLDARTAYGQTDGVKELDETELDIRGELKQKPYFYFWDLSWYRNPIKKYAYRVATGPGLGYYIWDREMKYLTVSYYMTYNVESYTTGNGASYIIHNMEQRYRRKMNKHVNFRQKAVYSMTTRKADDYYLDVYVTMESMINSSLSMEVDYVWNYQNKPVDDTVSKMDTSLTASVKYSF